MRKSKIFLCLFSLLSCYVTTAHAAREIEMVTLWRPREITEFSPDATKWLKDTLDEVSDAQMLIGRNKQWQKKRLFIRGLVKHGNANPQVMDKNGQSCLMLACQEDDPEVVSCLLDKKASPNERSGAGPDLLGRKPPLFECKSPEVVRALVAANADLSAKYFKEYELNALQYHMQFGKKLRVVAALCGMIDVRTGTRLERDSPLHILYSGDSFCDKDERDTAAALLLLAGVDPKKPNCRGQLYSDRFLLIGKPELVAQINRFAEAVDRIQDERRRRAHPFVESTVGLFVSDKNNAKIVRDFYGNPPLSAPEAKKWWDKVQSDRL